MRAKNLIIILLPFLIIIMSTNVLGACGACTYDNIGNCKTCLDQYTLEDCACLSGPCGPGCESGSDGYCDWDITSCWPDVCRVSAGGCCDPQCGSRICGSDPGGCGTTCGAGCPFGSSCINGGTECTCVPDCGTKTCGYDSCGNPCGSYGGGCGSGEECVSDYCLPDCRSDTADTYKCNGDVIQRCICDTSCYWVDWKNCLPGMCQDGFSTCSGGSCSPKCDGGKKCGDDDLCGNICLNCPNAGDVCVNIFPPPRCCTPNCAGKTCGDWDGCLGTCKSCPIPGDVCYIPPSGPAVCKKDCGSGACTTGSACCGDHSTYSPPYGRPSNQDQGLPILDSCHTSCMQTGSTTVRCNIDQVCMRYDVFAYEGVRDCGVKTCFTCENNPAACCVEGITASDTPECQVCDPNWYRTPEGHCCGKGRAWSVSQSKCIPKDPCYRSDSDPGYCAYRAPNCLLPGCPGPEMSWWGGTRCQDLSVSPKQACCYIGYGLYGYSLPSVYYYWHEAQNVVVY